MIAPVEKWLPASPDFTNGSLDRDPEKLVQVARQFDVESSARYAPANGATYCNLYATDVTSALAAPIPHWWLEQELNVNATLDWLQRHGADYGWTQSDQTTAQLAAGRGRPAVVLWRNPDTTKHGHIAVCLPGNLLAQAGAVNRFGAALSECFGSLTPLQWFTHL